MAFDEASFIDFRLNTNYRYGFVGGPNFATLEKRLRSGVTRRRPLMQMPLHRYRADYATFSEAERQEMLSAIWAAEGKAYSFRFRDFNDYRANDQIIAMGDGSNTPLQLVKHYTRGPKTKTRDITLPVEVTMTANGEPFTAFEVESIGGLVVPTTVWPPGALLAWSGTFDVCVRFANDYNPLTSVGSRINETSIELVEERYG